MLLALALILLQWAPLALIAAVVLSRLRYMLLVPSTSSKRAKRENLRVTFIHPDLGIGGAERLILDAALALRNGGDVNVRIVTNFFDPERCFHDAKTIDVIVAGSTFVPRHIAGKGHVLFASIRMFLAAVYSAVFFTDTDVFVVDQVSLAMVPLRLLSPRPVLFYCHFPDQLCDGTRFATTPGLGSANNDISSNKSGGRSMLRAIYRSVFDSVEAATMHFASRIVCNSEFTLAVTRELFPSLAAKLPTDRAVSVLNPPVDVQQLLHAPAGADAELAQLGSKCFVLLSVNRYERKKNIALAISAFAEFKKRLLATSAAASSSKSVKLVHAGGYDERLPENREHYAELVQLAQDLGVADDVLFLRSISDETKRQLLREVAAAVVYTPTNEHFGIVPVEAMACRRPVIAVNRGGPLESVGSDGACGLLTEPQPAAFAECMLRLYSMTEAQRAAMGERGKQRVDALFTLPSFGRKLRGIVGELST